MLKNKKKIISIVLAELLIFSVGLNVYQYKNIDKNTKAINSKIIEMKKNNKINKLPNKFQDFKLKDMKGKDFDTKTIAKNKSIVMVFFSSACPDCKSFLPEILKSYSAADKNKIQFIFISPTSRKKELQTYLENNKFNINVLIDDQGIVSNKYNVSYIPTTITYNKNKEIQSYHLGSDMVTDFNNVVIKSIK